MKKFRSIEQYATGKGNKQKIIASLKNSRHISEFVIVGIDQAPKTVGVEIDFLNRKTMISPVIVDLAMQANVPIIVAISVVENNITNITFTQMTTWVLPRSLLQSTGLSFGPQSTLLLAKLVLISLLPLRII